MQIGWEKRQIEGEMCKKKRKKALELFDRGALIHISLKLQIFSWQTWLLRYHTPCFSLQCVELTYINSVLLDKIKYIFFWTKIILYIFPLTSAISSKNILYCFKFIVILIDCPQIHVHFNTNINQFSNNPSYNIENSMYVQFNDILLFIHNCWYETISGTYMHTDHRKNLPNPVQPCPSTPAWKVRAVLGIVPCTFT